MKKLIATGLVATFVAIGMTAPSYAAPQSCKNISSCFNPSFDH